MNIEMFRNIAKTEPNQFVLHIGEQNLEYWLESYKNSRFQKVFWTAGNFYSRGYDLSPLEQATVTKYTNPWYYFVKCKIKDDGLLTNGLDDSYSSDFDFRFSFDTTKVKAIVIDEDVSKKEDIKLFLKNAENVLGFLSPDIIYVRDGLDSLIDGYAAKNNIPASYSFQANLVRTLNATGSRSCNFHAYVRESK